MSCFSDFKKSFLNQAYQHGHPRSTCSFHSLVFDCFYYRERNNDFQLVAQTAISGLANCNSSKFYNFWLSWEAERTWNMRYQLAGNDTKESSSSWSLLLSSEFHKRIAFTTAVICLNGSGSIQLLAISTQRLPRTVSTQGELHSKKLYLKIALVPCLPTFCTD